MLMPGLSRRNPQRKETETLCGRRYGPGHRKIAPPIKIFGKGSGRPVGQVEISSLLFFVGGVAGMPRKKADPGKDVRIAKEFRKLKKIFAELPKKELSMFESFLQNVAFMKATLEDLQEKIVQNGESEEYKNGKDQFGRKASADLQAYNSVMKNYTSAIKVLQTEYDKLPAESKTSKLEQLLND